MQENKRPVTVGLMFSLGHSTVVLLGAIVIASTASALRTQVSAFREVGGFVGTLISNQNFAAIGYCIVGLFLVSWIVSTFVSRLRRFDEIQVAERF